MRPAREPLPVWGRPAPPASLQGLPERAEVVVVGGGITGVSLLAELRLRDVDAVLLERDHLAAGASGRNAGFLLAGVSDNYARAVTTYGRDVAAAVWRFTLENHAMLVRALATLPPAGYRAAGSLTVALDAEEAESLDHAATLLREDGLPGELFAELPRGARRALLNPADGEVDPVRLVAALASNHARHIHEGSTVITVDADQTGVTVHLESATVRAEHVVLATNAWTAQLAGAVPIRPVRAQMMSTSPVSAQPGLERPVYAEWGLRYWRQRADGVVLVGGFRHRALDEEVGYGIRPTEAVQASLDSQLRELGVDAPVTHRWAGTMGFSPDGLPLVGPVTGMPNVSVCAGYTGHGMGFAAHCAAVLVAHILDSAPLPTWLDSGRQIPSSLKPSAGGEFTSPEC